MALRPTPSDDGPVTVHLEDGNVLHFDYVWHRQSGMVTLYDVEPSENYNGHKKGDRAMTIPRRRIVEIEYDRFG